MNSYITRGSLVLIVALSGACALIFQTVWFREFRLFFGGSTPATATVLAVFMGGLGLGNALLGKYVERSANPLRLYALFEAGIALSAALSPFLIYLTGAFYLRLGGQEQLGLILATIMRLLLSALVLIVPTVLMGGTLPAIAKVVTDPTDRARQGLALYYGINTLGAVLGTLIASFWLLEILGNRATLWIASGVGGCLSLSAWRLSLQQLESVIPPEPPTRINSLVESTFEKHSTNTSTVQSPSWIYLSAGIVGFAFFVMELVWYRMLGPLLGGNTFSFGLILGAALVGIGLGGALYSLVFSRFARSPAAFALTCGLEALALAIPFAWGDGIVYWMCELRQTYGENFRGLISTWSFIALAVVGPTAVVSGVQFPLLISLLGEGKQNVGRHVGWACTWNTLGAMLGSLLGGFGVLPLLSAPGTWKAVVILLAMLTLVIAIRELIKLRLLASALPLLAAAIAFYLLQYEGPTAIWRHSGIGVGINLPSINQPLNARRAWENLFKRGMLWEQDGVESSIGIAVGDGLSFYVNGKCDGNSIEDCGTQIMLGALGPLLHGNARKGLIVGLGTGESAGFFAEAPGMERVDVVELEPRVDHMAKLCSKVNFNVLEHPKVRRIYNDAREVLLTTEEQYDVIVSEPSNPYRAGVSSLFTTEFYDAVRQRLAPGGYFVQWLQGYSVSEETVQTVLATLHEQFETVEIWNGDPIDLLLVCKLKPQALNAAMLRERLREPLYSRATLIAWGTNSLEGVLAQNIANAELAREWANKSRTINSDDLNILEYGFARNFGSSIDSIVTKIRVQAIQTNRVNPLFEDTNKVNWDRVEAERLNAFVWNEDPIPNNFPVSPANQTRLAAYLAYWNGDVAPFLELMKSHDPEGFIELRMLAPLLAERDPQRMQALLEKSSSAEYLVTMNSLLRAICAYQAKQLPEAKQHLLASWKHLADDPWQSKSLCINSFAFALEMAGKDPKFAHEAFEHTAHPFAIYAMNEHRLLSQYDLSLLLDDEARLHAIEVYEPYILWDELFLKTRRDVYRATNHPQQKQAESDYALFLQHRRPNRK